MMSMYDRQPSSGLWFFMILVYMIVIYKLRIPDRFLSKTRKKRIAQSGTLLALLLLVALSFRVFKIQVSADYYYFVHYPLMMVLMIRVGHILSDAVFGNKKKQENEESESPDGGE